MSVSAFPALLPLFSGAKLDDEKRRAADRLFQEIQPIPKKVIERIKVFISFCEGNECDLYLVNKLVDPFLSSLGFDVHYYRKDISFGVPNSQIYSIMDSCDIIIGLYTKQYGNDQTGYTTAGNVIREVNREKPEDKFIFYEKGVKLETMTYPEVPSLPFVRDDYAKLLLDLVQVLRNSKVYEIRAFRKWRAT